MVHGELRIRDMRCELSFGSCVDWPSDTPWKQAFAAVDTQTLINLLSSTEPTEHVGSGTQLRSYVSDYRCTLTDVATLSLIDDVSNDLVGQYVQHPSMGAATCRSRIQLLPVLLHMRMLTIVHVYKCIHRYLVPRPST